MNVRPLGNRILVKQLSAEEVTKSGIILAQPFEQREATRFEILEVGDGEFIQKLGLKVGMKIFSGKYKGDEVDVDDDTDAKYKILYVGKEKDESDVLAVIE